MFLLVACNSSNCTFWQLRCVTQRECSENFNLSGGPVEASILSKHAMILVESFEQQEPTCSHSSTGAFQWGKVAAHTRRRRRQFFNSKERRHYEHGGFVGCVCVWERERVSECVSVRARVCVCVRACVCQCLAKCVHACMCVPMFDQMCIKFQTQNETGNIFAPADTRDTWMGFLQIQTGYVHIQMLIHIDTNQDMCRC